MTVSPAVVLDNTVLANFALAECTELAIRLWGKILQTTPYAMGEYREGVARGLVPEGAWVGLAVPEMEPEEEALHDQLPSSLGPGERSCLAVALRGGGILATDDLHARKQAAAKGVTVTGTVGILIGCIKAGLIDLSEGNRLLNLMIEHGYHSPASDLGEFVQPLL